MADLNVVTLVGRLTRDAELKYTQAGTPIAKFSLANNQRKKTNGEWEDEAHFFEETVFTLHLRKSSAKPF